MLKPLPERPLRGFARPTVSLNRAANRAAISSYLVLCFVGSYLFTTQKSYLSENEDDLVAVSVQECLNRYIAKYDLSKSAIIEESQIERSYGYQLFSGKRKAPSRDVLLRLALAMQLTLAEAQQLLRAAQVSMLYPRSRRDSIIIKAITDKRALIDCDLALTEHGEAPLSGKE